MRYIDAACVAASRSIGLRLGVLLALIVALLTAGSIVHPAPPRAAAGPAFFFEDNFDGTTLDSSHWTASTNGGLTVSVDNGSLHMGQGGSSSLDFPYVSSVGTVFPPSGNFQVEIAAQYSQPGGQGDGIMVLGPDHQGLFTLWGSGLVVALEGTSQVAVAGPLDPHNYRLTFINGLASIFVDNVQVLTAPLSVRPESLWLGHPTIGQVATWPPWSGWAGIVDGHIDPTTAVVQSRWWYGTNWSPFSVDYIRVSPLTDFKQQATPWATQVLGNQPPPCIDTNGDHVGDTTAYIGGYGCAVTAVADVLTMYGVQQLPDGSPLNPGTLNGWLASRSGFDRACGIYWKVAVGVDYSSIGQEHDYLAAEFQQSPGEGRTLDERRAGIDAALANNYFPIVLVFNQYGPHYVVLTGHSGDSYTILDPDEHPPNPNATTLSGRYGTNPPTPMPAAQKPPGFYDVHIYDHVHIYDYPVGVLLARADFSPSGGGAGAAGTNGGGIEFMVTDPLGRQTGYDLDSGTVIENLPNSSYGVEYGIGDDDGALPPLPASLYFGEGDPLSGTYTIQVIGTGSGPYSVDVSVMDGSGNVTTQTFSGTASPGSHDQYQVQIAGTAVGGIAELPQVDAAPLESATSSPNAALVAGIVAGVASLGTTLSAAAWYARRRWARR